MDPPSENNTMQNSEDNSTGAPPIEQIVIENLPLDKKLEQLKKYNSMDYYEEGRYIDALDSVNSWCLAEITSITNRTLTIHFDGWSNKWDCEYKINSFKVSPFRKFSRGYTGQNKVALRKMAFSMDELQVVSLLFS